MIDIKLALPSNTAPTSPQYGDSFENGKGECYVYTVHGWEFVGVNPLFGLKRGVK